VISYFLSVLGTTSGAMLGGLFSRVPAPFRKTQNKITVAIFDERNVA
jgi:hypothetical protein